MSHGRLARVLALAAVLATAGGAAAHDTALLREVAFDQRLDAAVPADALFHDDEGHVVRLANYLGGRPLVLVFAQYRCPDLCPLVLESLAKSLRQTRLALGRDYRVVSVGLDPRETAAVAARARQALLPGYFPAAVRDGWHFLTGDEASIRRLAGAVGFRYAYDRAHDVFAHPAGVVVLTDGGRVARYLFGMDFPARDLRLALVEAARGRIGSVIDAALLTCYHYDAATGRYTPVVLTAVRVGGALTLLGLGVMLAVLMRGPRPERRSPR